MAANQGVLRSVSQQEGDHEQAVKNLLDEAWAEWPNWAGVSGVKIIGERAHLAAVWFPCSSRQLTTAYSSLAFGKNEGQFSVK